MATAVILRWGVILVFTAWLLLTLLAQIKGRFRSTIKAYDVFSLVPIWTFFAPRPTSSDLCLMFRDIYPSGEIGPWQAVQTNPPRRFFHILWNPWRRAHAALLNLSRQLPPTPGPGGFRNFKRSVAHAAIVNLVMHIRPSANACARQFCFMAVRRTSEDELQSTPVFLSDKIFFAADEKSHQETSPVVGPSVGSPV